MLSYIFRRVLQSVLVLLVVGLVAFAMFRFVGDPIDTMLGQERTMEDIERLRESLGLNKPFFIQYWDFLVRAVQGDLGISYRQGRPVAEIIAERLPATLELAAVSGAFALIFGIVFGIFTAIRRDGFAANAIMTISLIGVSLPTFLIGILLILPVRVDPAMAAEFRAWRRGATGLVVDGAPDASGLKSLILPSITLGLFQMTLIMRLVRSEMLEVLRTDYIRSPARAA
jgi:peptide/nickel transport system permease protein